MLPAHNGRLEFGNDLMQSVQELVTFAHFPPLAENLGPGTMSGMVPRKKMKTRRAGGNLGPEDDCGSAGPHCAIAAPAAL